MQKCYTDVTTLTLNLQEMLTVSVVYFHYHKVRSHIHDSQAAVSELRMCH